jgi:hypothetical protein
MLETPEVDRVLRGGEQAAGFECRVGRYFTQGEQMALLCARAQSGTFGP